MDIFRIRTIEKLIEKKELENQEIFFASPDLLNDPMEGFQDIFWSGDFIVWKNLFKHYLICLERLFSIYMLYGEDEPILEDLIPIFHHVFPTQTYKESFDVIAANFFSREIIIKFIKSLSDRNTKVRREEMKFYLSAIHHFALENIIQEYEKRELLARRNNSQNSENQSLNNDTEQQLSDIVNMLAGLRVDEAIPNDLFNAIFQIQDQYALLNLYHGTIDKHKSNKNMVFIDFPKLYVALIEKLIYPDWFAACFMLNCKNSSVWGHYGDSHKGVCLIYDTKIYGDKPSMKLHKRIGYGSSGPIYDFATCQFHPVSYINGFAQIDFFRSLGTLAIPALNSTWYVDDGKMSKCAEHLTNDNDKWREEYWKQFYLIATTKSKDWAYEDEYRLILNNMFGQVENNEKGKALKYEFKALKGIVFGIKTTTEDKMKIIEIIEKKCEAENREDFKFYQATYSHIDKCIVHHPLEALKFVKS